MLASVLAKMLSVGVGFGVAIGIGAYATVASAQDKEDIKVRITEAMPSVEVNHAGQKIRIQRVQDTGNKLLDDFAKTSRPCPPFCLHPMTVAPGVETFGELELIDFMRKRVNDGSGIVIDARLPEFYRVETIPTSVNIPFNVISGDNPHFDKILSALGASKAKDGKWDFSGAKTLAMWCNGVWCDQSPRAIKALLGAGYPADKLKYYRGGMQEWKLLGLTTVVPRKN